MNAQQLLNEIFEAKNVYDAQGKAFKLESNVDTEEGALLAGLIEKNKPAHTIEIGCAQGLSSLFICDALQKTTRGQHTIVDPYQSTYWKGAGVANLQKAGLDNYELIEKGSELALPELYAAGKKFDFAFIDGWHTFDHTLIDFFYLSKMLNTGGIIIIDDVGMRSINKLMRYILKYPAFKKIGSVPLPESAKRKLVDNVIKTPFYLLSKIFPGRLKHEIFSGNLIEPNKKLQLNSSMVALQKISEDERAWNWFEDF